MPSQSGLVFNWTISPDRSLIPAMIIFQSRIMIALRALFNVFAAKIEAYARSRAPWQDVTGAARQGLRAFVEGDGFRLTIYLVSSVLYGLFLELGTRYMAPRPIIMPALQAHYAQLVTAITALIAGGAF
jgi:hypothetical protein